LHLVGFFVYEGHSYLLSRHFLDIFFVSRRRGLKQARNVQVSASTCHNIKKTIRDKLLQPRYPSRDDHNQKIRTRKQRTDVGKYYFVNMTIKSWKQLPASLLASFRCKLNRFKKRVKNVVTSKGIEVGIGCK